MAIFLEDIDYQNGDTGMDTGSTAPNLLGNILMLIKATVKFRVETWFKPTTADPVELNDASFQNSGWITDTSNLSRFADFNVLDSIEIECGSGAGHSTWDGTYTIVEKLDDNTIRVSGMDTTAHTMNHGIARNATEPTGFRYNFGIVENAENQTTSYINNFAQEYTYNAIPSSQSAMIPQGVKSWRIDDSLSIEGVTIERTAEDTTNKIWDYTLTHHFFINPLMLPNEFYDFINEIEPNRFFGTNTLKHVIDFKAYRNLNNPNSFQSIFIDDILGNVGWRNQNFNQGVQNFVISDLVYTNNSIVVPSIALSTTPTTITFTLTNTASAFVAKDGEEAGTKLILNFSMLPDLNSEVNKNDFLNNNYLFDRAVSFVNDTPIDGELLAIIEDYEIDFVSSTEVDITAVIQLTQAQINYINTFGEKKYYLSVISANKALAFLSSDITTVDIDVNGFTEVANNPVTFETVQLQQHDENTDFASDETTLVKPLDELAFINKISIDRTANENELTLNNILIEVIASNGSEDVVLQSYQIDLNGLTLLNAYPFLDVTQVSPLNVLPTETRKKIKVVRKVSEEASANEVVYWIQWPFMVRYEWWEILQLLTIPSFGFDTSEPNNGLNNDWHYWQQNLNIFGNGLFSTGTAEVVTFTEKTIATGTVAMVVNLQDNGGGEFSGTLLKGSSGHNIQFNQFLGVIEVTRQTNNCQYTLPFTTALNTNYWIVIAIKASGCDVFINGQQCTPAFADNTSGNLALNTIFEDSATFYPFGFDELVITDTEIATETQAKDFYNFGFGKLANEIWATPERYYQANAVNGTVLTDSGSDGENGTLTNFDLSACPYNGSNACEWRPLIPSSGLILRTSLNFAEGTFSNDFNFSIDDFTGEELNNGYEFILQNFTELDGSGALSYIPTDRDTICKLGFDVPFNNDNYYAVLHVGNVESGTYKELFSASTEYDRTSIGFFDGLIQKTAIPNNYIEFEATIDHTKLPSSGQLTFYWTIQYKGLINNGIVYKSNVDVVSEITPKPTVIPKDTTNDAICCDKNVVLVDLSDSDDLKNDTTLFTQFFAKSKTSATVLLQKAVDGVWTSQATITDNTYGTFNSLFTQGSYKLVTFNANWRTIAAAFGLGNYRLTIDGIVQDSYCVELFTAQKADNSVRLDYTLNSIIGDEISQNTRDFSGLNLQGSVRIFDAIFSYPKWAQTIEKERYQNGQELDFVNELKRSFTLEIYSPSMELINYLVSDVLLADEIFATDYNSINPIEIINKQPIVLSGNIEPNYGKGNRQSVIINFEDRFNNNRKLYN